LMPFSLSSRRRHTTWPRDWSSDVCSSDLGTETMRIHSISRGMLWILMVSVPLPYIANTAGWMTAELGRQPWLIYGLMRTAEGVSDRKSVGNAWFTLIGFMGMYAVLAVLWLFLIYREIEMG